MVFVSCVCIKGCSVSEKWNRRKSDYVQHSVNIRSRSENDTVIAETMLLCKSVSNFFTKGCLVSEKWSELQSVDVNLTILDRAN